MSVFEQTADRIGPIVNFTVNEINENSKLLIDEHASKWPKKRILKQNHKLDSVPVFEITYTYFTKIKDKTETGRFWVYGEGNL